jgi:hypothetical protein
LAQCCLAALPLQQLVWLLRVVPLPPGLLQGSSPAAAAAEVSLQQAQLQLPACQPQQQCQLLLQALLHCAWRGCQLLPRRLQLTQQHQAGRLGAEVVAVHAAPVCCPERLSAAAVPAGQLQTQQPLQPWPLQLPLLQLLLLVAVAAVVA